MPRRHDRIFSRFSRCRNLIRYGSNLVLLSGVSLVLNLINRLRILTGKLANLSLSCQIIQSTLLVRSNVCLSFLHNGRWVLERGFIRALQSVYESWVPP